MIGNTPCTDHSLFRSFTTLPTFPTSNKYALGSACISSIRACSTIAHPLKPSKVCFQGPDSWKFAHSRLEQHDPDIPEGLNKSEWCEFSTVWAKKVRVSPSRVLYRRETAVVFKSRSHSSALPHPRLTRGPVYSTINPDAAAIGKVLAHFKIFSCHHLLYSSSGAQSLWHPNPRTAEGLESEVRPPYIRFHVGGLWHTPNSTSYWRDPINIRYYPQLQLRLLELQPPHRWKWTGSRNPWSLELGFPLQHL